MSGVDVSSLTAEQKKALLAQLLKKQALATRSYPMSAGQQGLWHAYRRNPQMTAFNVFLPTRFRGQFRPEVLQQLIKLIVERHASLRTTFSDSNGQLTQTVHEQLPPDFSHVRLYGESDEGVRQRVLDEVTRPFDLERGPLLRMTAYQLADDDWIVLALTHHIVVDFWSLVVILDELRQAYPQLAVGQTPNLPSVTDNYREFVLEQQNLLGNAEGERYARYWHATLEGTPPVIELPTDRIRPTAFTHRAASVSIAIEPRVSQQVSALASRQRATPFAVIHAALQIMLSRYSRQESFFIGSPFSGRINRKYEQTVGFFINMLPIKANVRPNVSFDEIVRSTTIQLLDTLEHEHFPIAEIVRRASIPRDPSRSPLFQVSCTFEKAQKREELGRAGFLFPDQVKTIDFAGLQQESFYVPHPTCHYDLEFVFEQSGDGLAGMLIYCKDLYSTESMRQMARNFSELLESLIANSSLPIEEVPWRVTENQPPKQVVSIATPENAAPQSRCPFSHASQARAPKPTTVHELITHAAGRYPSAIALRAGDKELSYEKLIDEARMLSDELVQNGVTLGSIVATVCREGYHAFVGMLAVQLAGAAPVPVDATQPSIDLNRLNHAIGSNCILTDASGELTVQSVNWPPIKSSVIVPPSAAGQSPLAYMIYTSGSTGVPKGVLVDHSAICNTLHWRFKTLTHTMSDRVLMLLSHQFDASLAIAWSAMAQGATLIWAGMAAKRDPALLLEQIAQEKINVLPCVPSLLRILASHPNFSNCTSLRSIWTGGEAMPPDLPAQVRAKLPNVRLWNLYGPTETAVEATAMDVTEHAVELPMTIGRPIDGAEVMVVDSLYRILPSGVPGQLAIGGTGLARGYFNDEALTQQRFVQHAMDPSRRMYLTGDVGRQLMDGTFEFLGRTDHQIKLRGFRIELGEIESVLQSHPHVQQAAVMLDAAGTPKARLIAYCSPIEGRTLETEHVRSYLVDRLSHYKRPSAIIVLDALPTTVSGKVDRARLPACPHTDSPMQEVVPPRNEFEKWLAEIWCNHLNLSSVGIYQNFFEVGGSSLQAAIVTTQLSDSLAVHVPTALLFDLASIAQIARRITELYPQRIADRFGETVVTFYNATESDANSQPGLSAHPLLAPLKPTGSKPPIFMVHPPGGIVICYRELARHLPEDQPLWAIRSRGLHGNERLPGSIAEMASEYLDAIRTVQPDGPYTLGGWSLGGLVAYDMVRQLIQAENRLPSPRRPKASAHRLIFLDTTIQEGAADCVPQEEQVNVGLEYGINLTLQQLGELSPEQQLPMLRDHAKQLGILDEQSPPEVVARVLGDLQHLFHHHVRLSQAYRLEPIDTHLLLLRPQDVPFELQVTEDRGWRHLIRDVTVRFVRGHHHSMVQPPHVHHLAETIARELQGSR